MYFKDNYISSLSPTGPCTTSSDYAWIICELNFHNTNMENWSWVLRNHLPENIKSIIRLVFHNNFPTN